MPTVIHQHLLYSRKICYFENPVTPLSGGDVREL